MDIILDILPPTLKKLVESSNFENLGGITINKFERNSNDLTITFTITDGVREEGEEDQLWELSIQGVQATKVVIESTEQLSFYEDHFLLREYTEAWTSLYFNGEAEHPDRLLADIYGAHRANFGNWIEIEKYLNPLFSLSKLCTSPFGLFAKGPKSILEVYSDCLDKCHLNPHFLDSNTMVKEPEPPLRLLIIGDSYFIGEIFSFKRV